MTDNIPPASCQTCSDSGTLAYGDEFGCRALRTCPECNGSSRFKPSPAPVRISPEVRETILRALELVNAHFGDRQVAGFRIRNAIAFVEALP